MALDYESYYLPWYDSSYSDSGYYGEPLSSSEDEPYDDSYYLTYDEIDDYSNENNQDYGGKETPYGGVATWLGEYASYFGGHWGEEDSSLYEEKQYGSYKSYNDDMQPDYSENWWSGYNSVDDQKFWYNSSWADWEEMMLYDRIFGL